VGSAVDKVYTSVHVVTYSYRGKISGITVAWATRVSWDPVVVAVSVGRGKHSREALDSVDRFLVCTMGEKGRTVAMRFGTLSGRDADKFEGVAYSLSEGGLPVPEGSISYLECRKIGSFEAGDHVVYLGLVEGSRVIEDAPPLLFGEGRVL